jgi:hypothetical protein
MSRKVGEHTRTYYRRSQKETEVEGNFGEGTGSVKKYLATTMGRGLDMRSLIEKEEPAVR